MTTPLNDFDWDTHLAQINLRNDLTRALMAKNDSYAIDERDRKEIETTVSTYPDDLLRKISDYVDPASNPRRPKFGIDTIRLMIINEVPSERLNEAIRLLPLLDNTTPIVAVRMLEALHLYPQLLQSDDIDRTIIAQRTALLHVTYSMFHIYNIYGSDLELGTLVNSDWTLVDQKLVDIALTHPERGEAIREFIIQREHVNTDLIEDMLANETPVLNKGIL